MSRRASQLPYVLPLVLAACAGEGGRGGDGTEPGQRPDRLACPEAVQVDAFVFEEGSRIFGCPIEKGQSARQIALAELTVDEPFFATLIGADATGTPQFEVKYRPGEPGPHTGTLRISYGSAGESLVAEVRVEGTTIDEPGIWDEPHSPPPCLADAEAPLLDQALGLTGLTRDTFTFNANLAAVELLNDPFRLSWFMDVRAFPHRAGCFEGISAGGLEHAVKQRHPVAGAILHAAELLDRAPADRGAALRRMPFADALATLCGSTACGEAEGELPADLQYALAPVLTAIADGLEARKAMDAELVTRDADYWRRSGGNHNLGGNAPGALADEDRAYLLGENGRRQLYLAAAKIAFAVEHQEWARYRDRVGVRYDLRTDAGWIRVRDGASDTYADDGEDVLLLLDLGGDDVHLEPIAANTSATNAVSVAIDLGGADRYGYEVVPDDDDREGLLPSDSAGRSSAGRTFSKVSRQGAARNGIAMLFDFGTEDDRYESLVASQGYAHQGVGVLFDAGGSDAYLAELLAQGAGQFGIGIAIDMGEGDDVREAFSRAQGFGYVGGAGFLFDGGGNDTYRCDNGHPDHGGIPAVYESPQMPTDGNTSFCQGAGFGLRNDARSLYLSGGIGVLRDRGGDDSYEGSVFAQGTGYWQGTGVLSDGAGNDTYDAHWYVQGAAAHFAVGILADGGPGDDVFGGRIPTRNMSLGSGHDLSTGVLINDFGDDTYDFGTLAGGSSNCNGLGLFVDNGGADTYVARSDYNAGMGNISGECLDTKPDLVSIGVMIDAGGGDTYTWPDSSFPVPADGGTWGHARADMPAEHGAGLDAEGESGVRVESSR